MSSYLSYSPGDGWFQCVETDNPNVLIPGITHAQNYRNGYMELSNWTLQGDAYTSHMNNGDIHLNSEKHIFLLRSWKYQFSVKVDHNIMRWYFFSYF